MEVQNTVNLSNMQNAVNLSKVLFLGLNSFMHIYNMSVTYMPIIKCNKRKALGGVDFTKYALLPISQYVQWSKIG